MKPLKLFAILLASLVLVTSGRASVELIEFGETAVNAAIPDNNASGLARSYTVSGYEEKYPYIITVSLKITALGAAAFNGDFYADLRFTPEGGGASQMAVLLNRLGRTAAMPAGYSDSGLDVVLADDAAADIHNYRVTLNGAHTNPITGMLTGTWQPDRRMADPLQVLDTSLRATTLNSLGTGNPNGTWTLFVSDQKAGGTGQLVDWKVRMEGVPEPTSAGLTAMVGVIWLFRRKRNRTSASC